MVNNEQLTLTFKVASFRKIPNPYLYLDNGEKESCMYIAVCDVLDIPDNFPMDTNPREQKLTTNVAKKIKESLINPLEYNFYLLNRGLLLSAKEVTYNNYSNEITVVFEDLDVHGNVDGGHTYKTILENRDILSPGEQFVKIEILTGIENVFQDLAAARNTSTQVEDKSIAELENRFQIIKDVISTENFASRVYFKENDTGDIDVTDILSILNMFNIERYNNMDVFPITSYSGKKKCIDYYIKAHKEFGDSIENPYVKMKPIMIDIFKLYDEIETKMNYFYKKKNSNGRYGSVKGTIVPKNNNQLKSKFYLKDVEIGSPTGFIYPILGSFRALIKKSERGEYYWIVDPFKVLSSIGGDLVETTIERSRTLGNNPQSVGKDNGNWKTLYMTVLLNSLEYQK